MWIKLSSLIRGCARVIDLLMINPPAARLPGKLLAKIKKGRDW